VSNHNPVEICGNIIVHHPERKQAEVIYADWFKTEFDAAVAKAAQRLTQRGEAITFYRELEERRAA